MLLILRSRMASGADLAHPADPSLMVELRSARGVSVPGRPDLGTGPRWGRTLPEYHGQQRLATVSRPRRSAAVSKRLPRSPDYPDCLSHGGSQGFKSPHLHPTTALVTGLADRLRRAGALPVRNVGQQMGSNRE
jgi:hypothetical protein